jgi:phage protein D
MAGISWTLMIDGAPAPPEVVKAVAHIEAEEHLGMAGILRLHLGTALTEDGAQWLFVDDSPFERLAGIQLLVTLGTGLPVVLFDGVVVETEAAFTDEPGTSSVTVIAMDATARMNLDEKVREWPAMADSAIAAMIFGESGLVPVVDDTQPVRTPVDTTVIQRDTDIRFLRHLAHRNGFDVFVRPGPVPGVVEGHFHRPAVDLPPQGVLSVNMAGATNMRDFAARHEMLRPARAATSDIDPRSLASQPAEAMTTDLTELGKTALLDGDGARSVLVSPLGLSQTGELQTLAQASANRSTWAVTVEGEVDTAIYGDVLRAAIPVLVRGAGTTHSGAYLVERVRHRIEGESYTQRCTLRRNAVSATGQEVFLPNNGLPL